MVRRIPPLNPLRVFEAVARRGNLTLAAQELHVTQSAVSRQIAALETYVGFELLRRERHGVSLTRAGRAYAEQVVEAFKLIEVATEKLVEKSRKNVLILRTYTTFTAKWLIPRLGEFHRIYPHIDVRVTNAVTEVDFDRDSVDVAIQVGNGDWPRAQADRLFDDIIEPVCSPRYLAKFAPNSKHPESLLRHRLLESRYRRQDWDDWLIAVGLTEYTKGAERMSFESSVLTWQAAADDLGLAMGQTALLTNEFQKGALVRPFERPMVRLQGYYLLRPKQQRESSKVTLFRDWLLNACSEMQDNIYFSGGTCNATISTPAIPKCG